MFNLLPEEEKQQILSEYRIRRAIVTLIFLFIVGLFAVISIFPSYLLTTTKVVETQRNVDAVRRSTVFDQEKTLNEELAKIKSKLSAVSVSDSSVPPNELIKAVSSYAGEEIRLTSFSYKAGDSKNQSELDVSGVAWSRESLSAFVDLLKKDEHFKSVDIPVSNFAKDKNASFSITIKGNF